MSKDEGMRTKNEWLGTPVQPPGHGYIVMLHCWRTYLLSVAQEKREKEGIKKKKAIA